MTSIKDQKNSAAGTLILTGLRLKINWDFSRMIILKIFTSVFWVKKYVNDYIWFDPEKLVKEYANGDFNKAEDFLDKPVIVD